MTTSLPPVSDAVLAVLENPYLLGQILECLSMAVLLRIQRTCKLWKAIIETNPRVQRTLFLKPMTSPPAAVINTEVEDHEHWRYCRATIARPPESFPEKHRLFPVHIAHPLLGVSHASEMSGMTTNEECDEIWDLINSDSAVSWQRMYICQPPLERVTFLYTLYGLREEDGDDDAGDTAELVVEEKGGVTWGYLFDRIRAQKDFADLYPRCEDELFYIDGGEVCFQFAKPTFEDGTYCDLCDRYTCDVVVEI
ncbi:Hypothetical protein D9617_18g033290 [Elsinoe fawcettii]|nr:Hypothetical protein D9617_18g033290 [Elsinoe fawcettii]